MLLEGIFLPLTTPFHADGRLFLRKLEYNVARYSLTPAAGMVVLGREGEGDALTDSETAEVLKAAIGAAADEKVMIANVGRESVWATMKLVEEAASAGYDAVAIRPPWSREGDFDAEIEIFYTTIADRSPLPVVIVDDLESRLDFNLAGRLARHPNVAGAIVTEESQTSQVARRPHANLESILQATAAVRREVTVTSTFAAVTGRMLRNAAPAANFISASSLGGVATAPPLPALKTRTKKVGFQVLSGSTRTMLDTWGLGATGAVPRLAACAPQVCCEVWQAFKDGDAALAAEKQERILGAAALVEGVSREENLMLRRGIAPLKYGCDLNGYYGGRPRLPLLALTADGRVEMERRLAGLRN